VSLRNVRTGTVEAVTRTAEKGEFSFTNPPPGEYVVEHTAAGGNTVAVGNPFTLKAGETVSTFVRVGNRVPIIVPDKDPQPTAKPDPRENADTAVVFAIRLLEAGDHKMFLSQFMPPDELKSRAGTPEALSAFADAFGTSGRSARLLAALKNARTKTPAYDQAKTTATFQLDPQADAPNALVMVKIGTYWYLSNK
jgi:hypothetical protein